MELFDRCLNERKIYQETEAMKDDQKITKQNEDIYNRFVCVICVEKKHKHEEKAQTRRINGGKNLL